MTTAALTRPARFPPAAGLSLLLAFGLPAVLLFLKPAELFPNRPLVEQLLLGEAGWWLAAIAVLAVMLLGERRGPASIHLRPLGLGALGWGVLGAVVLLLAFMGTQLLLQALGLGVSQAAAVDFGQLPVWLILGMALRTGVVEEILFRGYAITRLEGLTGRTWLAALVSLAAFVALHVTSWSPGHLIFVTVAGGLLTGLYLWRRNLTANILAHTLVDAAGLLMAKYAMAG